MHSSLWYFITMGRSRIVFKRIKVLYHNYLWSGSKSTSRTHVTWDDCSMPKKVKEFNLILAKDAMKTLITKWVMLTLLMGKSNVQIILRIPHQIVATFFPWPIGSLLLSVVFPTILYKGKVQNLTLYYPIIECDGNNGCIPPSDNAKRYFATDSLVQDGIPRFPF